MNPCTTVSEAQAVEGYFRAKKPSKTFLEVPKIKKHDGTVTMVMPPGSSDLHIKLL
jgi:hypothetical protein